jgi:Fe-S cluster biosynthesis and repair protein YggX
MARTIFCAKLKREADGLDFPPFPGSTGQRIFDSISKEAWGQWLETQKMLTNENRLNMMDPKARKYLEEQREKHLFGDGGDTAQGFVPK